MSNLFNEIISIIENNHFLCYSKSNIDGLICLVYFDEKEWLFFLIEDSENCILPISILD